MKTQPNQFASIPHGSTPAAGSAFPRSALVTGASRGIGRAIAQALAEEGYRLYLTCRHSEKELTDPTRIVTSTVRVRNGNQPVVSVKTKEDIPKGKIMECMEAIRGVELEAPVHIGDVALADVAGTGVDMVVTKDVGLVTA